MGALNRLVGREKNAYHATNLDYEVSTPTRDLDGVLMEVTPHPDNRGPESMESVLEGMHTPATKPVYAFEIWLYKGEIRFFFIANDEVSADSFKRRIGNSYPDSEVAAVEGSEPGFPTISPEDSVAAAYLRKKHLKYRHQYLPIKYYNETGGGYSAEDNPIAEVINSMNASKDARIVVQGVFRPIPDSWSEYGAVNKFLSEFDLPTYDLSAGDAEDLLDQNGDGNLKTYISDQAEQLAFSTNLRVLSISPNEDEARQRASDVANMLENKYKGQSGARLRPTPIDTRIGALQPREMKVFVDRMRHRQYVPQTDSVFGAGEEPLHIPSGDADAPNIRWKRGRSGSEVPVDRPEHSPPSAEDSGFVMGGGD